MRLVYIGRPLQPTAKKDRPDAQLACPLRRRPERVPISAAMRGGGRARRSSQVTGSWLMYCSSPRKDKSIGALDPHVDGTRVPVTVVDQLITAGFSFSAYNRSLHNSISCRLSKS